MLYFAEQAKSQVYGQSVFPIDETTPPKNSLF